MSATERNEAARAAWREQVSQVDARKLVFVEESGSHLGLTPLYGRARHPANELMAAVRAIAGAIRP